LTKTSLRLVLGLTGLAIVLAGCSSSSIKFAPAPVAASFAPSKGGGAVDGLISEYASFYDVPEPLVRRVVEKESKFNPAARNGPYYGLMQISHATAASMGYKGPPSGLLDPRTNLTYAVKYLRGAYIVADGDHARAMRLYASGYYYDAKRKGVLREVGLGR